MWSESGECRMRRIKNTPHFVGLASLASELFNAQQWSKKVKD
jgi:hypothetical protein